MRHSQCERALADPSSAMLGSLSCRYWIVLGIFVVARPCLFSYSITLIGIFLAPPHEVAGKSSGASLN